MSEKRERMREYMRRYRQTQKRKIAALSPYEREQELQRDRERVRERVRRHRAKKRSKDAVASVSFAQDRVISYTDVQQPHVSHGINKIPSTFPPPVDYSASDLMSHLHSSNPYQFFALNYSSEGFRGSLPGIGADHAGDLSHAAPGAPQEDQAPTKSAHAAYRPPLHRWSQDDVAAFLHRIGLAHAVPAVHQHRVDGAVLCRMTQRDVQSTLDVTSDEAEQVSTTVRLLRPM